MGSRHYRAILWGLDTIEQFDHDRTAARDKMKCLIYKCQCKSFVPDRKYYRSTKK